MTSEVVVVGVADVTLLLPKLRELPSLRHCLPKDQIRAEHLVVLDLISFPPTEDIEKYL